MAGSPIHAYGLFWKADEIVWHPGAGNAGEFRLLGRRGRNRNTLQMADFRSQTGIYILYGNYGPHYAGLTRQRNFGKRLKDHLRNRNAGQWDRFSWFGFKQVLRSKDDDGLQRLRDVPAVRKIEPNTMIKEMEALLIKAMALQNRADSNFESAKEWTQVRLIERDQLLARLS
jgi:hypothetical protein